MMPAMFFVEQHNAKNLDGQMDGEWTKQKQNNNGPRLFRDLKITVDKRALNSEISSSAGSQYGFSVPALLGRAAHVRPAGRGPGHELQLRLRPHAPLQRSLRLPRRGRRYPNRRRDIRIFDPVSSDD